MIWATTNFSRLSIPVHVKTIREYWRWLKDNLKAYIRNSKKYQDWLENTRPLIIDQAAKEISRYERFGISYPLKNVTVKVYHYWEENQARDNSNKYDTIIDLFSTSGLITDDCWQVVGKNESEAECYHGEILQHLTTIDVTVRLL